MPTSRQVSPVLKLLRLVMENDGKAMGGRSWMRLNDALGTALALAVRTGFKFNERDFSAIDSGFRFSYWGGNDRHMLGERFYSIACAVDREHGENLSAARSFEQWKNRKPFIYKFKDCLSGRRLAIGADLHLVDKSGQHFRRERFKVTSFAKDGKSFVATRTEEVGEYNPSKGKYPKTKVAERVTVTHEMLEKQNAIVTAALGPPFAKGDRVSFDWCGRQLEGVVKTVNARSVRVAWKRDLGNGTMVPETQTFQPNKLTKINK